MQALHFSRKLAYSVSEREHWVSAGGGLLGILAMLWVSHALLGPHAALFTVASMGASAVLLFAAPHGALSQPWPVIGGHVISAAIGVTSAQWIGEPVLAASVAVAASIGVMYLLGCLHPPGGATALFAVLGGPAVLQMGYDYLFVPVLMNALVLVIVAVIYNYAFPWRRYPQAWQQESVYTEPECAIEHPEKCMIPHSALVAALAEMDTFVDVTEADLQRIYHLAMAHTPAEASP